MTTPSEESSASNASSDPTPENSVASSGDAVANESAKAEGDSKKSAPVISLPMIRPTQDEAGPDEPPVQPAPRRRYAALAAGISLAVVLGAVAGAVTMAGLARNDAPSAAVAQDMRDSIARLEREVAGLKAGIGTSQRGTGAQFAKLAERLDRAEKAQAEPAAKIAKIAEGLERLERRLPPQHAAADVTGSVVAKQETKPPEAPQPAQGWRLVDFYAGRAVVENRSGREFEVGPGSNLPGLGRVEGIRRQDGKIIVVTRNGVIAGPYERGRPSYFFRY